MGVRGDGRVRPAHRKAYKAGGKHVPRGHGDAQAGGGDIPCDGLAELAELSADWLWQADSELRLTWISDGFQEVTGVDPRRVLGKTRLDVMMPVDIPGSGNAHDLLVAERKPFRDSVFELNSRISDDRRWISIGGMPLFDDDGVFCGYRGYGKDVTEILLWGDKLADARRDAALAASDLERTIDALQMGVVVLEEDLTVAIVNSAYKRLWLQNDDVDLSGCSAEDLMELAYEKGLYGIDVSDWETHKQERLAELRGGSSPPREVKRPDGHTLIYTLTTLSRGRRMLTYYDVSELKQREEQTAAALEQSKLAQAVLDGVPSPVFVKDANLEFRLVNKAFARLFDVDPQRMIGKKGGDFVTPAEAESFEESERQVLETGEEFEVEEDFQFDGIGQSRVVRKNRLRLPSGKEYVAGTIFDITDLKKRETDAQEARERLASVLETLPAGVIIYDSEDRFVLANRKIYESLPALEPAYRPGTHLREGIELAHAVGYFRESGDPEIDRLYDSDPKAWADAFQARYLQPYAVSERRFPDGRWYKVFDARHEDGTFVGVRVDVTEIKERERQLKESMRENEVFRNLIDNVPVALYAKRPDLRLMYVNKGWSDLVGIPEEEAIGKTDLEVFGSQGREFMESDLEVLRSGECQQVEEMHTRSDGTVRHHIARKDALVASDGSLYLIGSTTDVSEMKQREQELREAREKAELADRAKTEFLANMSHEIRTPMNGVLGMAELLVKTEVNAKQKTFLDIIMKSGNALLTIINDILDFSKIDAGQIVLDPQPFKLVEAVEDVVALISSAAREKDLELIVRVDPNLPQSFIGDVGRIRQIVTNLLGNAVKFTDHGQVLVDLSGTVDEGRAQLTVKVADSGVGIPRDKLEVIFDKFSQVDTSSTRRHEGTGLGLAITSRLVSLMGGEIGVESEEGRGSTFWFALNLPVADDTPHISVAPSDVTGARILLVDDNSVNRTILLEQMSHWGFDACAAVSGEEGLQVLREAERLGVGVDCALIDFQMPGMSGVEMARALRDDESMPQVPLILLSSVDQSISLASARDLAIDAQLVKPARTAELLDTLVRTIQRHRFGKASISEAAPENEGLGANDAAPEETSPRPEPAPRRVAPPDPDGLDVLVAEDNEVNQLVFSQILGESNLRFEIVDNGRQAVDAWRRLSPRLILMDVSMPEMNGLEATREIRSAEGAHTVPIIGVTAHALKGDRERCLDAGMDDYLSKPISPKTLLDKIERWAGVQVNRNHARS